MKVGEIIKLMKKQGWYLLKHGTNHDKWTHKLYSNPFIPIPRHKSQELSSGVEIKIKTAIKEIQREMEGN